MKSASRFWITVAPLFAAAYLFVSAPAHAHDDATAENPLTVAEICDKLKSGSTSDNMLAALNARHLLEKPTATEETALRTAGATQHLVDVLDSGTYTLSPFDANSARKRMAAGATGGAGAGAASSHMASLLRGKLITVQNGSTKNYDDTKLVGKKVFGLYYSASWCGPCRQFTPKLVQFYQQVATQHPEMEIVLIGDDESAADMQKYMQTDHMPWPALRFERKALERELTHYCGNGIPDLVLVDGDGKVLSDSYVNKQYVGPYKVGNDLAKMIGAPPAFN